MRPLLALCALALAAGCAPVDVRPERLFLAGDERGAIEGYALRLEETGTKRRALDLNLLGTAALVGGDIARARTAFIEAGQIMGSFPGRQTGALVGAEASKVWLGDPYEQAMNSLYTAFTLIATGDEENARAAVKGGILADGGSKEEEYQSDIAALFLLDAWLSLRIGKDDVARLDLERVLELVPGCPLADAERLRGANTLVLIDIGDGPQKIRTGRHGELATFVVHSAFQGVRSARIGDRELDGVVGVDVGFQATTRGGRAMDAILGGKAVVKDAAEVAGWLVLDNALEKKSGRGVGLAGGLFLLSAFTRAEADIRHWHLLPTSTYLWIGRIEPGLHDVEISFGDLGGTEGVELPEHRQSWHHLPFADERLNAYYFRSGPRRGFGHAAAGSPPGNPAGAERGSP